MKTKLSQFPALSLAVAAMILTLNDQLSTMFAQGTAFTYQGRLASGASAANGVYDFSFVLYDAATAGVQQGATVLTNAVSVSNGLFSLTLDFGNQFTGNARWLDIAVRTNGAGAFTELAPRQQLTPTPYAITAENLDGTLPSSQLSGTVPMAQLPPGILTNYYGAGVNLGSLTLGGNLYLPATSGGAGVIYAGGTPLIRSYGTGNFFAGPSAGNQSLSGNYNVGVGYIVLAADTSGAYNAALGAGALQDNTSGSWNTASGYRALTGNTTGNNNTANGIEALQNNTTGNNNTANGAYSLANNTNGSANTANGNWALQNNTTGANNTAQGVSALAANLSGSYNTANGVGALAASTSGDQNTANGIWSLTVLTNGSYNAAFGGYSLAGLANGSWNTAIGYGALDAITNGLRNIALGYNAGVNLTSGSDNIDIGNGGVDGDNGVIRIGTAGTHTTTVLAGNVGIGSATPDASLVISGAAYSGSEANFIGAHMQNTLDGGDTTLRLQNSTKNAYIRLKNNYDPNWLKLDDGTTTKLVIANNGNVGIGKASPATALDVNGTVTATGFSGNGAGLTSLNPTSISSGTASISIGGNAAGFTGSLAGDVTGTQSATVVSTVSGVTAANVANGVNAANAATSADALGTIVKRDASGNFSAGTITAALSGNATSATSATTANNFSGSLSGDVTGTQSATVVSIVGGVTAANVANGAYIANNATSANTASAIVKRDASGNFSAGTITAALSGNATTATTANNFSGSLSGNVTGTQGATVVSTVGGVTAANVASGANAANAATSANTASTIVKRDTSGNFNSGNITLSGNLYLPATSASAGAVNGSSFPLIQAYGSYNIFAGGAGNFTMTGSGNVGVGYWALQANTSGGHNTASGYGALYANNGGSYNTALGYYAIGETSSGGYNTGVGAETLYDTSGTYNIALGYMAGYNITTGNYNIDIGSLGNTGDDSIIRIGSTQTETHLAGDCFTGGGYRCRQGINGSSYGNSFNFWWGNSQLHAWIDVTDLGVITTTSDRRLKQDIHPMPDAALPRIMALKPSTFAYKAIPGSIFQGDGQTQAEGFIADELQQVIPSAVNGQKDALTSAGTIQPQTVNPMPVIAVLTKAVQEQQQEIKELKARLEKLEQLSEQKVNHQ